MTEIEHVLSELEHGKIQKELRINRNWHKFTAKNETAINKLLELTNTSSIAQALCHLRNNLSAPPRCENCQKEMVFTDRGKYERFCGRKCATNASTTHEARIKTNLALYGVEHAAQSPEIQKRVIEERTAKYGAKPAHLFGGAGYKASMLRMYGNEQPMRVPELVDRHAVGRHLGFTSRILPELEAAGFTTTDQILSTDRRTFTCTKCNTEVFTRVWCGKMPRCPVCWPHHLSTQHKRLKEWLEGLGVAFKINDRAVIKPLEIDILIPELKLGIEVDGVYYHSMRFEDSDPNYHQTKTLRALEKGITLIHVYEDQVDLDFENITSRIKTGYLDLDPVAGIEIEGQLEVDGSWPLPQQFSVKCVGASKPRIYIINPIFRPKVKNPIWDSGTLLYEALPCT